MANLATTKNNNLATTDSNDFAIPEGFICTLDIDTIDGKMQLATALNGAVSMSELVDVPLNVTDIVTTQGTRARTGEICTNTYLICDDGNVYFSQSDGVARSIKILTALFTDKNTGEFLNPVEQGVAFMVKETKLNNGNTLKSVVPVKVA